MGRLELAVRGYSYDDIFEKYQNFESNIFLKFLSRMSISEIYRTKQQIKS